ncbi:hypothetical protein HZA76_00675 [Candidatus Roizmanbacteria bacterium]|nr:hypothetical protein [Candidatus Roizmanbacteria bacterium]
MIGKIFDFFKKRPGLAFLIAILTIITAVSLKPGFYLLGWDNYSSYFNLKTNIFRTFFSTWREYRGLGVPSDAEVTDVFRQIFYWITNLFLPEQLLDQVYYLLSLWVGILSAYAVSDLIFKNFFSKDREKTGQGADLFAVLVSLFYLFNLNTLSIFASPIIPFTNRFYSMPLTIYLLFKFLYSGRKKRDFLWLALAIVVTSGSYVTPTVFITSFAAFGLLLWFMTGLKKTIIYSLIFLSLNAFWLLPFFNYTVKKSPIIPLARTFIEINESTLNQPKSNFSLGKQAALFPSFFDIKFPSLNGASQNIHPLLDEYNKPFNQKVFLMFPIIYTLGGILLIKDWKKYRKLLWMPVWIVLFLFLSTKQYGPLGFLYSFMDKHIPFFGIIFRIGDTKFHAYINFAGSFLAGYFILRLLEFVRTKKSYLMLVSVIFIAFIYYVFLFRSYFTGNLINYVLYVKIPQAYYDVAEKINKDPNKSRVLHLPFDSWHHYWRSYSWGYLGSAFYNYFLDKPYIDKTFEPGSVENVYLHSKINSLISSFYRASNESEKSVLADRFYNLASKAGIKYILLDESISSSVYPKNINYTAKQSYVASQAMMLYLYDKQMVVRNDYDVNFINFYNDYTKLFPLDKIGLPADLPKSFKLYLFEIPSVRPEVSFIENARIIDDKIDNALETDLDRLNDNDYIQDKNMPGVLYPFMQQNHTASLNDGNMTIKYKNGIGEQTRYSVRSSLTSEDTRMFDFYGKEVDGKLVFDIYHRYLPDIEGNKYQKYVGSISLDSPEAVLSSEYKFSVNGNASDLPEEINEEPTYLVSFLLTGPQIDVSLLAKKAHIDINPSVFENRSSLSDCPLLKTGSILELGLCNKPYFVDSVISLPNPESDKQYYVEPTLSVKGDVTGENPDQFGVKPVHAYACYSQNANGECLNFHRNFLVDVHKDTNLYSEGFFVSNQVPLSILFGSIPFDDFKQAIIFEKLDLEIFEIADEKSITFSPTEYRENLDLQPGDLTLDFPRALSNNSYYFVGQMDFYDKTIAPCGSGTTKRVDRIVDGVLVNKMEGCLAAFAQIFNYSYKNPYLLLFDYWVGSGQQPLFSLKKESDTYLIERASIYQGYPNIKGMKGDKVAMTTASRIIEPRYHSDTGSSKVEVNFFQDTINQGNLALGGINMIELPTDWYSLAMVPENGDLFYTKPKNGFEEKSILPSLKMITIKGDNTQDNSTGLLYFNEGYDNDWGIYDSVLSLMVGTRSGKTLKCSGYANCFEIENVNLNKRYYLFYWPEKLYFFGWFLTILVIILSLRTFNREPLKTE